MKEQLFHSLWALLTLACYFTSCNNDDEWGISVTEIYNIRMFVTNDDGEDLILNADKYYSTLNEFRFDTWEIYLNGQQILTANDKNKYGHKQVFTSQDDNGERKNIILNSNCKIQDRIKDHTQKHIAEYVISSSSLFGDTEKHIIRMEFWMTESESKNLFYTQYFISVDNVKQEVFYPEYYKGLFPKSQYKGIFHPYFVLNVDAL